MNRAQGYTLLELMVVIALMGLATALVAPGGYRMITAWRDASDLRLAMAELDALPLKVRASGRALRATPEDPAALAALVSLPDGWTLSLDSVLEVRANGACSEASALLQVGNRSYPLRIEAPFCRTREALGDGA